MDEQNIVINVQMRMSILPTRNEENKIFIAGSIYVSILTILLHDMVTKWKTWSSFQHLGYMHLLVKALYELEHRMSMIHAVY